MATLQQIGVDQRISPARLKFHWQSRRSFRALLFIVIWVSTSTGPARAKLVSINVCTDELVLDIAKPQQIQSLSYLSHSFSDTSYAKRAMAYPINHGNSEEIITLKPDLVLMSQYSSAYTKKLLHRVGIKTFQLPIAHSVNDMLRNVRLMANVLNRHQRGDTIVQSLKLKLHALSQRVSHHTTGRPTVLSYTAGGWLRKPPTLLDDIIRHAGAINLARQFNKPGWTYVPYEAIVRLKPDYLIVIRASRSGHSLSRHYIRHPIFDYYRKQNRIVFLNSAWIDCGNPVLTKAIDALISKIHPNTPDSRQ